MIDTTTALGATTRNKVSPHGRGASNATRPAAHAHHNGTLATTAGACDQSASASATASPAANGKTAQLSPRTPQADVWHLLSGSSRGRPYTTKFMPSTPLAAGMATGVGSLRTAMPTRPPPSCCGAFPSFRLRPSSRSAARAKGVLAQWMHGVVGIDVADDGAIRISRRPRPAGVGVEVELRVDAHAGLVAFVDADRIALPGPRSTSRRKSTGPLTLGLALTDAGVSPVRAFASRDAGGSRWAVGYSSALRRPPAEQLARVVLRRARAGAVAQRRPPLDREFATDCPVRRPGRAALSHRRTRLRCR